jgi:hypothetical protein
MGAPPPPAGASAGRRKLTPGDHYRMQAGGGY